MKALIISIQDQIVTSFRIKQSIFFTVIFPVFLFVIFSLIWGVNNEEYSKFLLTGICAMTVVSDGVFAIGSVIPKYYSSGILKFIKVIPYSIITHIISLIISRVFFILVSFILLFICGYSFFGISFSIQEIISVFMGLILGLLEFSFLGLIIFYTNLKDSSNKSFGNILYFGLIFFSDTFYPITEINPFLGKFVEKSPITPLLEIFRYNYKGLLTLSIWTVVFIAVFYLIYKYKQVKRSF
ncbi:MAG: ABC transporter permease [Tannerellaceae bacterium]|jgi:ABC-2 type transport system permease protein|nr:ABC transporter permease [Tannerellaceae bacterium]